MSISGAFALPSSGRRVAPLSLDQEWYLRNRNPHTRIFTSPGAGPDTQVAPSFGALVAGADWENTQRGQMANPARGANPAGTRTASGSTGPFETLRNVKNPELQSAIDSILSNVRGMTMDPNINTNVVRANVKDQPTAQRIAGAGGRFDLDVNDTRQSFADFAKAYLAGQGEAQNFFDEESAAIGRVFDPNGLQGDLNRISEGRSRAVTTAAQRAIQNAIARTNAGRMVLGDNSYLDAQMLDAVGGINAQAAREKADLDRLNLLAVLDAQTRLGGQRGALLDRMLTRGLLPIQARQQIAGNELAQLAGLTNLTNANTFYQLDSPEQMMARRLGLLGDVGRLDALNNFYGLAKPYEPNYAGYVGMPSLPSLNGFNFPMDLFGSPSPSAPLPTASGSRANPTHALARNAYFRQTGVYPEEDPYFSQESWNAILAQLQPTAPRPVRQGGWWDNFMLPNSPGAPPSFLDYPRELEGPPMLTDYPQYSEPVLADYPRLPGIPGFQRIY